MTDKKIYVYAPSMAIISYAAKRWLWSDIVIISGNYQICEFCKKAKINIIELQPFSDTSLKGLKKYKKYIIYFAKQFSKCNFIFGHNSHDYWGLFLINCISKNGNTIYYNSQFKEHPKLSFTKVIFSKKHCRLFLDSLILLLVLRKKFNVLSFGEYSFIGIDIKSILNEFTENKTPVSEKIFSLNQNQVINEYNIVDVKIILIDQGEAFYKYTNKLIECIISIEKNHKGFYLKQHPNLKTTNEVLLKNLSQIPAEIPIELITTNNTILIGIASNSIKFTDKSISLIYLVNIEQEIMKKYLSFLNTTFTKYPQSTKELIDQLLLLDISSK
jgi:hypothetical protein